MLESVFITLVGIAVLFSILGIYWKSLAFSTFSVGLWFVLALGVHSIEKAFQYTTGGVVYTSTQSVESMYGLSWLFIGLGIVMMLWVFVIGLDMLRGHKSKII